MTVQKPLVLLCALGVYGHFAPLHSIARELVARGYDVTFVTSSARKGLVESVGAKFIPVEGGAADFTEEDMARIAPDRDNYPPGPLQVAYDLDKFFIASIPGQYAAVKTAMNTITEAHPGRPIVLGYEALSLGATALLLGAPGLKPVGSFGVGIMPVVLSSIDAAPFGPGLPPDSSPEGRARNIEMNKQFQEGLFAKPFAHFKEVLREIGVKQSNLPFFFDVPYLTPDRYLQMCIPSAEYQRSDAPASLKFAGCVPKGHREPFTNTPSWWSEVTENKDKTIIFVAQGTVVHNYANLIIPTMKAFEDRKDILVIAALGRKGATLPEGTVVPENARVLDWIPYDEILPHSKVFVTNGGYGAFQHAIANGKPMVAGGAGEDKPEVCARAEYAGLGVNLKTGTPTPELILESVEKILADDKYEKRGRELEEEMKLYDAMDIVERTIQDLAEGK